jgi:hypothetical protein
MTVSGSRTVVNKTPGISTLYSSYYLASIVLPPPPLIQSMTSLRNIAVVLLLALAGCGSGNPPTYPVTGKVTLPDGSPLAGASVEFETKGPDGKIVNARGETDAAGIYKLTTFTSGDGALAGEHRVIVAPPADTTPRNMESGGPPPLVMDRKYMSYGTSGLSFTVKPEPGNTCDIPLR